MMITDENLIFDSALALPKASREVLIEKLIAANIDESDDHPLSPVWQAEVERRIQDYRAGKAIPLPLDKVVAAIRQEK